MSRNFIGSQIAIVTKSQCRYVGTIIGIDSQTSSILLGNVKCFGTENRPGSLTNGPIVGTTLPIMQFANSDIEDLKIVDKDQTSESPQQQSCPMPVISLAPAKPRQPSIHDDPAIVSAVISSSNKDSTPVSSIPSRLMHQMTLSDEQSKTLPKNEESHIRSNSGELGASWSLLSPSKWGNNNNNNNSKPPAQQQSSNKSKFFDDFLSNNSNNVDQFQSNRYHQRSSNTHSTQTLRENGSHYNGKDDDDSVLPVRQPFFSSDQSYPQDQLQQQNRHQNGNNMQHQQRFFYNNRRPPMPNQQQQQQQQRRGGGGGGNRETFQNNPNSYEADFDFETSNRKFNKISGEDELKQNDLTTNQFTHPQLDNGSKADYAPLYDKKLSFFDSIALTESSDTPPATMYNYSKNKDTFGNEGYQRQNNRPMNNGYRRPNNNYRQQQQQQHGNDDFYYRQQNNNNNGYNYRY